MNDFVKIITVQEYASLGISLLGPKAALLADAEGLGAHAAAIRLRMKKAPREPAAVAARKRRARA